MSNLELFDRVAGNAMCDILEAAGPSLIGTGIWLLPTGLGTKPGAGLMGLGAASLLAKNYLCNPIDVEDAVTIPGIDGCAEVDGYGTAQVNDGLGRWFNPFTPGTDSYTKSLKVTKITENSTTPLENGFYQQKTTWDGIDGAVTVYFQANVQPPRPNIARILVTQGSCRTEGGEPEDLPPDVYEPREYFDSETNCNYTVTFQGFAEVTPGGDVQPVLLIEGGEELRAGGGRIGGCNLSPTIYMPNGGGGGTYIPGPPGPPPPPIPPGGDDVPWWLPPLLTATAGALLNSILAALTDSLNRPISEASFTLTAPCDKDPEGNQLTHEWLFPAQPYWERVLNHQVATLQVLQQHLDWKTPICDDTPIPEGDFRTVSFRSVETSPYGKSRLRKRFRYRSLSGNDLSAVVDHWKDFSFEGGPYRVRWIGGAWRSPEIWAASEAEGQRVIQHAAEEAGVSPLEGGRWSTRLSGSGRQGVPGTMKIDTTGGYYWITARDGSDQRPIVALT